MNPNPVDIPSLSRALEWVEDAVEVTNLDGYFIYVNPAWCRLTGYTFEETRGQSPRTLLRGTTRPAGFYDEIDERLRKGEPFHGELVSRRKDGVEVPHDVHVTPVLDPAGRVLHFVVVRHDLTLRREAERLREIEGRLERAVRGANDGLWEYDLVERRGYLTQRCMELVEARSAVTTAEEAERLLHPEDRARAAVLVGQLHELDEIREEVRIRAPGGAHRWVQVRARVYRDASGAAERVAGAITDIQAIKDAEAQALEAATRDPVTNLPNRRIFVERVQLAVHRARRSSSASFAVLFIDLRKFKQVNDRLGHAVGDELLRAVAERIRGTVRPGDTVARMGGDEFGVLLEPLHRDEQALATARRVERALAKDFHLGGRVVQIAGTVGAVLGDGQTDVDTLIRDANAAMYAARADGRVGHGLADPDLRERVQRRAQLERDVANAIRRREVAVAFQPIVETLTHRPVGAEALVRWRHPELGWVPPMELLSVSDDLDLGADLGILVLEKSVDWLVALRNAGLADDDFVLHVNANARQLTDPRFAECLRLVARGSGVPAGRLFVEVTETVLVDRPDEVAALMAELVDEGLSFALDDFGTGWSSLAHLRRFPVRCIKIDRSFTCALLAETKPAEIVRGLASMAHALGMSVVAEGVETEEEAEAVAALGCAHAQGYLYARPAIGLAARDALAALTARR